MEREAEVAQGSVSMTISKNGLVCNVHRHQEWQWTAKGGGLLCHPTLKDNDMKKKKPDSMISTIIAGKSNDVPVFEKSCSETICAIKLEDDLSNSLLIEAFFAFFLPFPKM